MPPYNVLVLGVATSGGGATPAATFAFVTQDYRPPRQDRSTAFDTVHNQNGVHRYVYDNGPGPYIWSPFRIKLTDDLQDLLGKSATQQLADLEFLWQHIGPKTMLAPEGTYTVHWAGAPLEKQFRGNIFPGEAGDKMEMDVTIHLEEG